MKDEELVIAQSNNTAELSALESQYTSGLISATDYYVKRKALEDSYATFVKDNENAVASYTREQNDLVAKQEEELLRKKNDIAKRQFEAQRLNDIAQATIQGALAVMKGFAQLGPIGGAINAGIQAGITAVQIATIASQRYVPMLAKGGIANSATLAMIGENGKEAVLPLEKTLAGLTSLQKNLMR